MSILFSLIVLVSSISKSDFYNSLESTKESVIEQLQQKVQKSSFFEEKNAYLGAVLMKKASFQFLPNKKLGLFLDGKALLENAVSKHPENAEIRFIRLMIQENSPKFLGYYSNQYNDAKLVKKEWKNFPVELQFIVKDYSRKSTILKVD